MPGQHPVSITQSQKRKRDDVDEQEIDARAFTIKVSGMALHALRAKADEDIA